MKINKSNSNVKICMLHVISIQHGKFVTKQTQNKTFCVTALYG
jgi:hypothetical protein